MASMNSRYFFRTAVAIAVGAALAVGIPGAAEAQVSKLPFGKRKPTATGSSSFGGKAFDFNGVTYNVSPSEVVAIGGGQISRFDLNGTTLTLKKITNNGEVLYPGSGHDDVVAKVTADAERAKGAYMRQEVQLRDVEQWPSDDPVAKSDSKTEVAQSSTGNAGGAGSGASGSWDDGQFRTASYDVTVSNEGKHIVAKDRLTNVTVEMENKGKGGKAGGWLKVGILDSNSATDGWSLQVTANGQTVPGRVGSMGVNPNVKKAAGEILSVLNAEHRDGETKMGKKISAYGELQKLAQ